MKSDYTPFRSYCEKAIGKLDEKCISEFKDLQDDESRIKLLYETARCIPVKLSCSKSLQLSQEQKDAGNKFFSKKDYANAIKSYNAGIILCPQDTESSRELLSILISNRSACYFELREFKRVFNDIDYLTEIGNYPPHLQYKLWLRKAKCYDGLQNIKLSNEAYDSALAALKHSKLPDEAITQKIKEITNMKNNKLSPKTTTDLLPVHFISEDVFAGGEQFIAASKSVLFEEDSTQGRYARAAEDIGAGTIILEENAHCSVVSKESALSNCQYCLLSCDQPTACATCANVAFCSTNCARLAQKSFHRFECAVLQNLNESGASVNCFLAMRIISQKPISYFRDKRNKLKEYLKDNCAKSIIKKKVYRFDDYDNVFFLCRNEALRKKEELVHYSIMAVYLLRLLKYAQYFGANSIDEHLSDDEAYIGALILRHLQMLQFNAHEISELRNNSSDKSNALLSLYENQTIGAGLYPTLALFNHSCDPSIVRYNVKNKIVVRAVKPIRAGDIIYENYGPLYMVMAAGDRQEELKTNYWFECLCIPCVELWPKFEEMDETELRIPCKTDKCPFVFSVRYDADPFLICDYCGNTTSLFPNLKGLMTLEKILPEAEGYFTLGQLDAAMKKFIEALEILYKFSKPPHPEFVKVQQRLRVCMVHLGNKSTNYIQNLS